MTFTSGPEGSPEIACAAHVAKVAGVQHLQMISRASRSQQDFDASWKRLRQHAYRFEGYVCPWDGAGAGALRGRSIEMTGFGGELYRGPGGHAKQFKNLDFMADERLIDRWVNYHQRMDPFGILRPLYRSSQIDWLAGWLDSHRGKTRVDVLPEKFFVENRLSHWNGPLAQSVIGRVQLAPLLSPKVARLIFKLHPRARSKELFHYSVMAKVAPRLVGIPFLNASWDSDLKGRFGLDGSPTPWNGGEVAPARSIQAWQREFVENQRQKIVEKLRDAKNQTDIDSVFDVDKICKEILNKSDFNVVDTKIVMSSIAISHLLLRLQERVIDECSAS